VRSMEMRGRLLGVEPSEAFDRLADFEKYAEHAPSIRSIEVERVDERTLRTKWNVNFRGGTMRWTEEDRLDPEAKRIDYDLVEGSLKKFSGAWEVKDADDGGSEVRFTCDFEVGMPAMASLIDPLAERAIRDNIEEILRGLFGPAYEPAK
jgi:ribosome-associated toxin RatA of RatAB toxin-antitoxin module